MAMSREASLEQLDGLLHEISSNKISVLRPDGHPLYQRMLPKHPVAAMEIPNKLFLLWSDLKSMEKQLSINVSKYLDLVTKSLPDHTSAENLSLFSPANTLEARLRKECSRICKKYHGLRWGPKERLRESSTIIMVFENEGSFSSAANETFIHKLRIDGKFLCIHACMRGCVCTYSYIAIRSCIYSYS